VVSGDAKSLIKVLANLLNNAAKYTPLEGLLRVETGVEECYAHVSLSDNDIGMNEDLIVRAFELFTQAEHAVDRAQGGLSIGLAAIKRLLELHDGVISAIAKALEEEAALPSCCRWLPHARRLTVVRPARLGALTSPFSSSIKQGSGPSASNSGCVKTQIGHQAGDTRPLTTAATTFSHGGEC
jgi:hypothetical protein